jgi:hypothetical protein
MKSSKNKKQSLNNIENKNIQESIIDQSISPAELKISDDANNLYFKSPLN